MWIVPIVSAVKESAKMSLGNSSSQRMKQLNLVQVIYKLVPWLAGAGWQPFCASTTFPKVKLTEIGHMFFILAYICPGVNIPLKVRVCAFLFYRIETPHPLVN